MENANSLRISHCLSFPRFFLSRTLSIDDGDNAWKPVVVREFHLGHLHWRFYRSRGERPEVRVSANKRMVSRPARRWPFIFPSSVVRVTPISDPECRSRSYNKTNRVCSPARESRGRASACLMRKDETKTRARKESRK